MIMKLYGFPPSPNTWKVRAVAAHLGLPLEFELIDLAKRQQRTPEFLALNPTGRTPVLVDGGLTLWESTAIMQYLADQTANSLWPDDPRARADITRWQSWQLAHFSAEACGPVIMQRVVKAFLNLGPPDPAVVEKGTEAFDRDARVLDGHLAKQPYLVGDDLTLADFAVAAPLFLATRAELSIAPYAHLRDWFGRVSALPAWHATAPQPVATAA
jgi:glutathione S-transferase